MNLYTLRENLKRTIAGKELLLQGYRDDVADMGYQGGKGTANVAVIQFIIINIDELKKILADVEICYQKEVKESWVTNPDRMGGQSTPEDFEQYKWK